MKRTPLKRVSSKRAKELREYAKLRKAFLEEHPYCQVWMQEFFTPNWVELVGPFVHDADVLNRIAPRSTEIHHVRGRWGKRLNDTTHWLAVCPASHDKIHNDPAWAYERGYLKPR